MSLFSGERRWVYTKRVDGRFQRLHRATGAVLQVLLFLLPWLSVSGLPLVRVDLPARRLFLFGQVFVASEGFYLVLIALLAAFALFFVTALFGRVWCGYVCPQSVTLEEWVRPIEAWIEGDRAVRMRRDQGGLSWDRIWRKALKWTAYAALAVAVSTTLLSYFAGAPEIWTGRAGPVDYTLVGLIAGGLFLDWAWFREQLCNYLCPYARFQGALTDAHSLIISYDSGRGEPRGKGRAAAQAGHCIDCRKCVEVCPAGIDIREGFQLECIACARCVDACEAVMPRLGFPSLVRYSTAQSDEGGVPRLIRPRTLVYAGLLAALTLALLGGIARHEPLEVVVHRTPGSLFFLDPDGSVRNTFLVQITNNDPSGSHLYMVSIHGLEGAQMAARPVELGALQSQTVPLMVRVAPGAVDRTAPFTVRVAQAATDPTHQVDRQATFKAPPRAERGGS
jgi:cytochrome c oxidase accessory protein FixG